MKLNKMMAVISAIALVMSMSGCKGTSEGKEVEITQMSMPASIQLTVGDAIDPFNEATFWTDSADLTNEEIKAAADALNIIWTVTDDSIAKMDDNGSLCAVAAGETELTASTEDGLLNTSTLVTVNPVKNEKKEPTPAPSAEPTVTPKSTAAPTAAPTKKPHPTVVPTSASMSVPTVVPTSVPTIDPVAVATSAPTAVPTAVPTSAPTAVPSSTSAPAAGDEWTGPRDPGMNNNTIIECTPETGDNGAGDVIPGK